MCDNVAKHRLQLKSNYPRSNMSATLTEFFEKIYVLNLSRRPDRRKRLNAHLDELGVLHVGQITWIEAVDGDTCPAPAYFRGGNHAWGCLQTHSRVVQDAALQGVESCLILEDDVIFHERSASILKRFLPAIPAGWEQVYLGGQHLKEPQELYAGSPIWRGSNVNRLHAYGLHKRIYKRFLQHIHQAPDYIERGSWHLDHQIGLVHESGRWQVYCPAWWIAGQSAGESNISRKVNAELWWQPGRYATKLPFLHVRNELLTPAEKNELLGRVHFGCNLQGDTLVDAELEKVFTGYKGLGEWLDSIAREALDRYLLPGICHPGLPIEKIRHQWPNTASYESSLDLAALGNYPFNGAFDNALWAGLSS